MAIENTASSGYSARINKAERNISSSNLIYSLDNIVRETKQRRWEITQCDNELFGEETDGWTTYQVSSPESDVYFGEFYGKSHLGDEEKCFIYHEYS